MSAFTDLSYNKIGDSYWGTDCFPSFPCFLALISWVLFSESLGDPA
jgi:hypothetical protein